MNVEIKDKVASNYILRTGDIIEKNNEFGIVFLNESNAKYTVLDLEDGSEMMDNYSSCDELTKSANSCGLKFYPKAEYKLILEKI